MHAVNVIKCDNCVCLIQLGVRSSGKQHPLYQLMWNHSSVIPPGAAWDLCQKVCRKLWSCFMQCSHSLPSCGDWSLTRTGSDSLQLNQLEAQFSLHDPINRLLIWSWYLPLTLQLIFLPSSEPGPVPLTNRVTHFTPTPLLNQLCCIRTIRRPQFLHPHTLHFK